MNGIRVFGNPHITALYTFFQITYPADFLFRGEAHDFYELVCVTEGRAGITADHRVFELEAGQMILHPPMQFHSIYGLNDSFSVAIFSFSGRDIPALENRLCRCPEPDALNRLISCGKRTLNAGKHYIASSDDPRLYTKELERFLLLLQPEEKRRANSQSARNYAAIIRALQQNLHRRLTVSELANLCSMSEINLQKTFSRYAGVGVMDYFNRIKMQEAIHLLQGGSSVKEAALQLGFTDQNYFSTAFKRTIGKSPSDFK